MKFSIFFFGTFLAGHASAFQPTRTTGWTPKPTNAHSSPSRPIRLAAAANDYTPLDGEQRMNLKIDLDSPKVATQSEIGGDTKKNVYCRCWLSGTFPLCDGSHVPHNKATGDNVGPLIVSVAKTKKTTTEESADTKKMAKRVAGRKQRLILGYKAILVANLALAGLLLKLGHGVTSYFCFFVTGNMALPVGVAPILVGAAQHNRLGSDTYKRLNLALLAYGAIGLTTIAMIRERRNNPIMVLPFLLCVINAIKGYSYGVLGWDKQSKETSLLGDLVGGVKSTLQNILPQNMTSAVYLAAAALFGFMKLTKAVQVIQQLYLEGISASTMLAIRPNMVPLGKLTFLTAILYTLKDAADRSRLQGTTFIQLNYLAALVMASNAAFNISGMTTPMRVAAAVFAAFSGITGLSSYLEKQNGTTAKA